MIPSTVNRVPAQTDQCINQRIRQQTIDNIARYANADSASIQRRLNELDEEWDVERTLEANAATATLISVTLGLTVNRKWFVFPAIVGGFLLQHALQGWCPPLSVFRRLGVRTSYEIDYERFALKAMRGDFAGLEQNTGTSAEVAMEAVEK